MRTTYLRPELMEPGIGRVVGQRESLKVGVEGRDWTTNGLHHHHAQRLTPVGKGHDEQGREGSVGERVCVRERGEREARSKQEKRKKENVEKEESERVSGQRRDKEKKINGKSEKTEGKRIRIYERKQKKEEKKTSGKGRG